MKRAKASRQSVRRFEFCSRTMTVKLLHLLIYMIALLYTCHIGTDGWNHKTVMKLQKNS
jgi:hypothetical protein